MGWREFIAETIELYRQKFKQLSPEVAETIQEEFFYDTLLEPCQVEGLVSEGEVAFFIVHDENLDDMRIEIHEGIIDTRHSEQSKFMKKYSFKEMEKRFVLLDQKWTTFWTRDTSFKFDPEEGRPTPEKVVENLLADFRSYAIKEANVDTLRESTNELKSSIARLPKSEVRSELVAQAKRIDGALTEIRRIDKEIGGVRRLMGVSKEYQDWRLLVSDVSRLKGEHVPREVFESKVSELSAKVEAFEKIEKAYERLSSQQEKVLEQQSSFLKWIKYSTILVPIAVACIPIIEIIIRHILGSP